MESAFITAAKDHAEAAEVLLQDCATGTPRGDSYAPSLITRATAAQAHASLSQAYALLARDEAETFIARATT